MTVLRTKKRRSYGREPWKYMAGQRCQRRRVVQREIAKHAENCKEFEKRIGRKMEGWWMGLAGRIDEGLLEIIRTIDEEQKNRRTRRQTEKETRNPTRGNWNQIIYLL